MTQHSTADAAPVDVPLKKPFKGQKVLAGAIITVEFFGAEDIPMDAGFVVSGATGYKNRPHPSSGYC